VTLEISEFHCEFVSPSSLSLLEEAKVGLQKF
jgi:hypothetical protein